MDCAFLIYQSKNDAIAGTALLKAAGLRKAALPGHAVQAAGGDDNLLAGDVGYISKGD